MGRKSKGGEGGGLPAWMGTYGDMMTLLLCFFVLLFAMSSVDSVKYRNAVYAFRGTFGVMSGGASINQEDKISSSKMEAKGSTSKYQKVAKTVKAKIDKAKTEEKLAKETKEALKSTGSANDFSVTVTERGVVISVAEKFLFDSGKATLKQDAGPILDIVLGSIVNMSNNIAVEGYTDNVPINTFQFPSNWELSGARAASVVRYFSEKSPELSNRISLAGYGETRPKATNSTIEGRSANRRVEIVILKSIDEQYEEKAAKNATF